MLKYLIVIMVCLRLTASAQTYDLVILNGKIVDGTGNPWFMGDVAINGGKIVKVGNISANATRTIDANGMIVCPGFIDVHTHIEGNDLKFPTAKNFIHDGVTTVVTGNCGFSNVNIEEYFSKLDSVKMSINVATLIGHNDVRRAVMGQSMRDPDATEQRKMEELVNKAMEDGAVGFSSGLIYVPGTYSKTAEVVRLAKIAASHNGLYASHIRNEGDNVLTAIDEALLVGRQANMPVEISHFKVTYKPNWGKSEKTIAKIEQARQEGIDVTIDQYPYIASSTSLNAVVPTWVFSGGKDSLMHRLNTLSIRKKIITEMRSELKKKKLKNYSYAVVANYPPDTTYNGKNISEISALTGSKPSAKAEAETILDMIAKGHVQMVFFSMSEDDLRYIMKYPYNMFASDAGIHSPGLSKPHPRGYGTNARVLGHYVREQKVISLEEAVRRMTSLPARKFQLRDRGILQEGMAADIVIFDARKVRDAATFTHPHSYSVGFEWVIVNGMPTLEEQMHNDSRNGMILRRQK